MYQFFFISSTLENCNDVFKIVLMAYCSKKFNEIFLIVYELHVCT